MLDWTRFPVLGVTDIPAENCFDCWRKVGSADRPREDNTKQRQRVFVTVNRTSHPIEENNDRRATRISSAFDHFLSGFRRNGGPLLAIVGRTAHDQDGRTAQFSIEVEDNVLKAVSFNVTTCATLIAYCEYVAEGVTGATLSQAVSLTPEQVIAPLKGIPPHKHHCARLAVSALHAAVETALDGGRK